jgi:hypothetical protein
MDAFDAGNSPETATLETPAPAEKISPAPRKRGGMTAQEAAYMRGGAKLQGGSIPHSTSRYLNSPLFAHAWTQKSLRRNGLDVPMTYDIPDMSRALDDVQDFE